MPYRFSPPPDVWKPHSPFVFHSHIGFGEMDPALLCGCRIGTQPPLVLSKFQGTLSPLDGPVAENRMPRSRKPFGTMSRSFESRRPLLFRSSPRVLLTSSAATVGVAGLSAPRTNMEEKVTSSSGRTKS